MHGRLNDANGDVVAAMQNARLQEAQQLDEVRFLRANHMEVMRKTYMDLVSTANVGESAFSSVEFLDSMARHAKLVADRLMIANGFMHEPK